MASSSSYSPPPSTSMSQMKPEQPRNWAELPPELISSILLRLNSIEILETAQKVCRSWRRVCKDPSMWRKIDMDNDGDLGSMGYDLEIMCRHAVDRSQGGLLEYLRLTVRRVSESSRTVLSEPEDIEAKLRT
ncbi:hypothetical protein Bca101_028402 [Brassica carinata]